MSSTDIASTLASGMIYGALTAAAVQATGIGLTAAGAFATGAGYLATGAGLAASGAALPVLVALGCAAYGTFALINRLDNASTVGQQRANAIHQAWVDANLPRLPGTLAILEAKFAALEAMQAKINEARAAAQRSRDAASNTLTVANDLRVDLQLDAAALLAAAETSVTRKQAAEAIAADAEKKEQDVERILDAADADAENITTQAGADKVLAAFQQAKSLAVDTGVASNKAAVIAAELDKAAAGVKPFQDKTAEIRGILARTKDGAAFDEAYNHLHEMRKHFDASKSLRQTYDSGVAAIRAEVPKFQALFPADAAGVIAGFAGLRDRAERLSKWTPAGDVGAVTAMIETGFDKIMSASAAIAKMKGLLAKIPTDIKIESARDAAKRADTAYTLALGRVSASAGLEAKARNWAMGTVPAVVKLSAAEAQSLLVAAGFTITWTASSRTPGADDKPGTVEQQNPAADSKAKRGTAVTLTVLGPKPDASNNMPATAGKLKVPSGLPGMTEADAVATVRAAGFTNVAVVAANSPTPDGKGGTVEQHVPAAGEADATTTVTLYVFLKPGEAIVPGVQGLTVREAKLQIEGAKLKTGLQVSADSPPEKKNEFAVQAQSHAKGEKLKEGEVVTLSIYPVFGKPPANGVPDLIDKKMDVALGLISGAKMKIGGLETLALPKDKQDKADTVVRQTPAPGQPIPEDQLVSIVAYAPIQRADADGRNPDLGMADAATRDSSVLVGKYQGTYQRVEAQGMIGGDPRYAKNQDMTPQDVTASISKSGNDWSFGGGFTATPNSGFSFGGPNVVNGQSLRFESKGARSHEIWEIVYDNGQLTGTHFNEDLGYQKATGKRWFYRAVFHASRVP